MLMMQCSIIQKRRSAAQLQFIMDRGLDRGYLPAPAKSLFIADNLKDKEAARCEFKHAGLNLNYVRGSQYLGAYMRLMKELETWVRPKFEAWAHGVCNIAKIANRYP